MKARPAATLGFVADGYERFTRNAEFRAREQAARQVVAEEFAPRLAAARDWQARWRVRGEWFLAGWRAQRALHPSPQSCYLKPRS